MTIASTLPLRVEAGDTLELRAEVADEETPLEQLEYAWSASRLGSTFMPVADNPRVVRWTAPPNMPPGTVSFALQVTERYQDGETAKSHQVTATTGDTHYNDSRADVVRIATRFLTELFPDYRVTPIQAVQDFSDSCRGKQSELRDVTANRERRDLRILSGTFTNVNVTLNTSRTMAAVWGACAFRDLVLTGPTAGRTVTSRGTCSLTAIYEQWNWFLCDSAMD